MASKGGDKKKAPVEEKKEAAAGGIDDLKNKQAFKKFAYRGEDIIGILAKPIDELAYL